jgi:cyclophilin family peptidyl-prolyl cis-trans isomerase
MRNQVNKLKYLILVILLSSHCSNIVFNPEEKEILSLQNSKNISSKTIRKYLNSSERVKDRLVLACANSDNPEIIPDLIKIYNQSSPGVRKNVAFALSQFQDPRSKNFLVKNLIKESCPEIKEQLALSLGKIGEKADLVFLLGHQNQINLSRLILLRTIGYFFDNNLITEKAINYCIESLDAADYPIGLEAATTLTRCEQLDQLNKNVNEIVKFFTESINDQVKIKLIKILNKLNFKDKLNFYRSIMQDSSPLVKVEAAKNLIEFDNSITLLRDIFNRAGDNQVRATILKQITGNLKLVKQLESELIDIFETDSSHYLRGLAYQNLITISPDKYNINLQHNENLLYYKVNGFGHIRKIAAIDTLYKYSYHSNPKISTAAYQSLLAVATHFYENEGLSKNQLKKYIIWGLESLDPVQIALAIRYIRAHTLNSNNIRQKMYKPIPFLIKKNNPEALLELIETIRFLYPQDGVDPLWQLMDSESYTVAQKAAQVLKSLYNVEINKDAGLNYRPPEERNLKRLDRYGLNTKIKFITEKGNFVIQVSGRYTPYTYSAFLKLVESRFYNGLSFHRVIPNFVIQGGDPRGDGWGGPGFSLLTEVAPISFSCGAVGMANAGPDTEGSQFFITTSYQPHLDYEYTNFGKVVKGMDIIRNIAPGDKIQSARIME